MSTRFLLILIALGSFSAWAGDRIIPPNVRLGLWEVTETHNISGMPGIPPETLAKMTPEQRAHFEATMKQSMGGGKPTVRQSCLTKEDLDKGTTFADDRAGCTRTVLRSSSTMTEMRVQCKRNEVISDGTFKFEALSPENVKGTMRMTANVHGRTMNMDFDFTSKYLGPTCGDVK